jgi:hypothetical protein
MHVPGNVHSKVIKQRTVPKMHTALRLFQGCTRPEETGVKLREEYREQVE